MSLKSRPRVAAVDAVASSTAPTAPTATPEGNGEPGRGVIVTGPLWASLVGQVRRSVDGSDRDLRWPKRSLATTGHSTPQGAAVGAAVGAKSVRQRLERLLPHEFESGDSG